MKTLVDPSKRHREDVARFRREKDEWHERALGDNRLGKGSIRLAGFIALKLNAGRGDFGWGEEAIADRLNVDARTVRRAMQQLREFDYIERLPRRGRHGVSIYRLLAISSTGQPCPIEGTRHLSGVATQNAVDAIVERVAANARPDNRWPSTGQVGSLDRTPEPPKPNLTPEKEPAKVGAPQDQVPNASAANGREQTTSPFANERQKQASKRPSYEDTLRIRREVGFD